MVEGRSHSRSTRYTTIAIKDVPYPNGLGKTEYEALYDGMVRLLGSKHYDQDTNADMFWTPQYQRLIATRLEPYFGRRGSIIANASKAAEMARGISIFDRELAMDSVAAEGFYRAEISTRRNDYPTTHARDWTVSPPRICFDGARYLIDDGRHRLSLLRTLLQQSDPNFQVLVVLTGAL